VNKDDDDDDDDDDQGHAGLTTSWRGLTSRVLICYTSHETEALTHPRSQPSQSDDGEVTCHDMTDELSTRDSMGYFYGAPGQPKCALYIHSLRIAFKWKKHVYNATVEYNTISGKQRMRRLVTSWWSTTSYSSS